MSQCVPSWALDEPPSSPKLSLGFDLMLDYEVAELTCENGHIVMHGLGPPRTVGQLPTAAGTLESIVNQATTKQTAPKAGDMLVPWFDSASATVTLDAMVPGARAADRSSTRVCSSKSPPKARVGGTAAAAAAAACEGSSRNNHSVNGEEMEVDTCGFTSTSDYTDTNAATVDERDSVSHSRTQETEKGKGKGKEKEKGKMEEEKGNNGKSSVSTKRSRAAAIHNQSERKRRDKINQKMKTLQKLVPNSSKTDKASMLDEVIDYLKQLQAHVQIMSRMGMPNMMMNMTMQQQLQMYMMAQMGLGMGMAGMGMMDMNAMARAGSLTGIPPAVLNPAAFMPYLASWDGAAGDRGLPSVLGTALPADPFSTFLASQRQPMTMDNYSRMAALYQQLQQQSGPGAKN